MRVTELYFILFCGLPTSEAENHCCEGQVLNRGSGILRLRYEFSYPTLVQGGGGNMLIEGHFRPADENNCPLLV